MPISFASSKVLIHSCLFFGTITPMATACMPCFASNAFSLVRVSADISKPYLPVKPPPRFWPINASIFFIPELSILFSASLNENSLKVHICTPNLNPAVDPVFIAVLSVFTELLSVVAVEEEEPLHPTRMERVRRGKKKQANRFIGYFLLEE